MVVPRTSYHYSAECTIIQSIGIIMSGSNGSFYTLFMLQLRLGKVISLS